MPGHSLNSQEMVRSFEQLNDCLTKCKDVSDCGRITYCIDEVKRIGDAVKYSECISNNKYMYQFTECSWNLTKPCKRGDYTFINDFKISFEKINTGLDKLKSDLDIVLTNEHLVSKSSEDFLKDESVKLVLDDVSLLYCDLMRYSDQIDLVIEIVEWLSYTGFLCGSLVLTMMYMRWSGWL
jgi:hypothetical protein